MPERAPIASWKQAMRDYDKLVPTWRNHVDRYAMVPVCDGESLNALDAGCGTGYGSEALKGKGYDVTAFDIWPGFAERARALDIAFHKNDFASFGGGQYDVICCFEVIEHLALEPRESVKRLASWLKPSGTAWVSVPIAHPDKRWHKWQFPMVLDVWLLMETQFKVELFREDLNFWCLRPNSGGGA